MYLYEDKIVTGTLFRKKWVTEKELLYKNINEIRTCVVGNDSRNLLIGIFSKDNSEKPAIELSHDMFAREDLQSLLRNIIRFSQASTDELTDSILDNSINKSVFIDFGNN